MIKNPPANVGGHKFDSWSRKIPCAKEQLIPCATATERTCSRAHALQKEKSLQ